MGSLRVRRLLQKNLKRKPTRGSLIGLPKLRREPISGIQHLQERLADGTRRQKNHPINNGMPSPLFSLRGIPALVVLALFVAFTQMWINAHKPPTAAQDEIMNQYYEAEAGKNAFSRPTAQDEIMNLYFEAEARKNALGQLQSAPTEAENSVVAPSSSLSSPMQDFHLRQERSSTNAVSDWLRSDARTPVSRLRNHIPCRERGGRLNHQGDCRTR